MTAKEKVLELAPAWSEQQAEAALEAAERVVDADTSVEAIVARHGERRATGAEFERHCGSLAHDGEG